MVSVGGFHYLRVLREGAVNSPEFVDRFAWIHAQKATRLEGHSRTLAHACTLLLDEVSEPLGR